MVLIKQAYVNMNLTMVLIHIGKMWEMGESVMMKWDCLKVRDKVEFKDTKGVIRFCKLEDRQQNGQRKKDKQRSTKHYT